MDPVSWILYLILRFELIINSPIRFQPSSSSATAAVTAFIRTATTFPSRKNSVIPRTSLDDDDEGSDSVLGLGKKKPQFYSEYFKRYELMIELYVISGLLRLSIGSACWLLF